MARPRKDAGASAPANPSEPIAASWEDWRALGDDGLRQKHGLDRAAIVVDPDAQTVTLVPVKD